MPPTSPFFDLNLLRAFVASAETGSYSAAAQSLGVSQPTIGRQVTALEASLGVALFERANRSLQITPHGKSLLPHAQSMMESAATVVRLAGEQSNALAGRVCISAGEMDAIAIVAPLIPELRKMLPEVRIELRVSNQAHDLRQREADIALRAFRPREPEFIARRLRDREAYLYASVGYLQKLGLPTTRKTLSDATFIGFDDTDTYPNGLAALGLKLSDSSFPLLSQNQSTQWALVKAGVGIGIMTPEVGDHEPGVVRILSELPPIAIPMWLVTHRELRTNRRVRTVANFLYSKLNGTRNRSSLMWKASGRGKGKVVDVF